MRSLRLIFTGLIFLSTAALLPAQVAPGGVAPTRPPVVPAEPPPQPPAQPQSAEAQEATLPAELLEVIRNGFAAGSKVRSDRFHATVRELWLRNWALEAVVAAKPDVFNHNLETVPSKYLTVRPGARYFASLRLLERAKELDPSLFTKSGVMVGLGEKRNEVLQVMDDMRAANVDFLTIGQYLQPTPKHHAVERFVAPEEFAAWCPLALPASGPYWLRFRNGAAVDYCTGFSPPDDWLSGASLDTSQGGE